MTEEEKNEIYKEAFKCMLDNEKTSKDILSRFSLFETQYRHLNFQDYGNIRAFLDKEPTFRKFVRDTIDEKSKQNQIFENLKKAIEGEESIIEQIKALSRKRVVAVIGKNHELINGVFTYLWLTSPYCNNKPEGWLLPEIPIIRYFCSVIGEYMPNRIELLPLVLFIVLNVTEKKENLYKIQEFLERRSNQINNIRSNYIQMGIQGSVGRERMVLLKDTNCESEVLNILVRMVSDGIMPVKEFVISMDTLPAEFKDQFDPIYLEPDKQRETIDISQDKTGKDFVPFPTPSGTQWHEVKISFIDEENVKISARDKTENRHYSQAGFKDDKSNKPIFLWKFLKELASLSGKFTNCPPKEKAKVKGYFYNLRKALFQLLKIDGDPIPYKKTKDYTGYETAFIIENKSYAREYEKSVRGHHREYIPPKKTHHSCRDENENENEDNDYNLDD